MTVVDDDHNDDWVADDDDNDDVEDFTQSYVQVDCNCIYIKHATFIHRLKKFHIMSKRFNSNTKKHDDMQQSVIKESGK